jgi:hypothetical protein
MLYVAMGFLYANATEMVTDEQAPTGRGWILVLNPDGTTTAWNPDRTKILHSHGPPARAG